MIKNKIDIIDIIIFLSIISCTFICILLFKNDGRNFFMMYMLLIAGSSCFLKAATFCSNRIVSGFFWLISTFLISYVFCFRNQTGIDDITYKLYFEKAANSSLQEFLSYSEMEIGYKISNYIIFHLSNGNYNVCQFIFSFIPILLFQITFWKKRNELELSVALLYFYMTLYYFIMSAGLVRIFFSVSIIFFGLKYILKNDMKRYIACVLIASLFHYSSLVMFSLLLLLINDGFFYRHIKLLSVILLVIIPIILVIVSKYLAPTLGVRYEGYALAVNKSTNSLFSFVDKLPFLIIGIFYIPVIQEEDTQTKKEYRLYLVLILLTISVSIGSMWTDLGRIVYYTNCGIILLMSFILKNKIIRNGNDGRILSIVVTIIPYVFLMHTIFNNNYIWNNLNNYKSIFC
ncbi:EpsG family protein [Ruminococcus albus]|uniref:EpsG family protein n=1 Tax=Ruminococcus albus TaxID=1264 RepID=UPI0004670961|nr:EpsG family protein [Ruminococcus albus]